jgi:hypothetical protein
MKLNTALIKKWFAGCKRSWTMNAGTFLAILGVIQANITALSLTPEEQGYALIAIGVLMALLRAKTSKPISER